MPIPSGLDEDALRHSDRDFPNTLSRMYRWLHLLDMAITPAMLRQALTPDTDSEVAEALLRYFVRRREPSDINRDKTDLIATFLYRHPRVPGQWEQSGYGLDGALPLSPFEIALIEILADTDVPSLPEEHVQLLRRFDPFIEEVSRFRDFNALIDSGMIGRVRELKQWLDSSFYHPGVLATVSAYNAAFGKKFDELFAKALGEIKSFGQALEEMGGTILTHRRWRGGHGRARSCDSREATAAGRLRQHAGEISPGFKAEERTGPATADPAFAVGACLRKRLDLQAARLRLQRLRKPLPARQKAPLRSLCFSRLPSRAQQLSAEEGKLRRVEESIRVFVRVADPKYRQISADAFLQPDFDCA